jgi:hypothetical protein
MQLQRTVRLSSKRVEHMVFAADLLVSSVRGANSIVPASAASKHRSSTARPERADARPDVTLRCSSETFNRASAASASRREPSTWRLTRRRRPVTLSRRTSTSTRQTPSRTRKIPPLPFDRRRFAAAEPADSGPSSTGGSAVATACFEAPITALPGCSRSRRGRLHQEW